MVDSRRQDQIADRLDAIETGHKITVLYACESGSRAWGFPSTDSDYDVRFVHVLRALLAVRWIEQDRGPVPVEFDRLLDAAEIDTDLQAAIDALLDQKRSGAEQDAGPRLPTIHAFIKAELERQKAVHFPEPEPRPGVAPLNTFFRTVLDRSPSRP